MRIPDILAVHRQIEEKLTRKEADDLTYHRLLTDLKNDETLTVNQACLIKELKRRVEEDTSVSMFRAQAIPIIVKYTSIMRKPVSEKDQGVFMEKKNLARTYILLYQAFLKTIQFPSDWTVIECVFYYHQLHDKSGMDKEDQCVNCPQEKTTFEYDENNKMVCTVCCSQFYRIENGLSPRDYTRINTVNKFNYNRILHFQDCIRQYQGKQNCRIPEKLYKDLDEKFQRYRLLNSNQQVRYSKITRNHIIVFLKELKYIKHYENVNFIYFTLTNKRFDDITELEDKLIEDFKQLIHKYDSLHANSGPIELQRKNFMNVQYLLFQLLKKHNHTCKIEDFTIIKTLDRKLFHDNICKNLFQQLNWKFTPIF